MLNRVFESIKVPSATDDACTINISD